MLSERAAAERAAAERAAAERAAAERWGLSHREYEAIRALSEEQDAAAIKSTSSGNNTASILEADRQMSLFEEETT